MNDGRKELVAMAVGEAGMISVMVFSISINKFYPAATSLIGMLLILLPFSLRRLGLLSLPWELTVCIFVVNFLHSFGIVADFYGLIWWWDSMTHLLSTFLIGWGVIVIILIVNVYVRSVHIPIFFIPVMVIAAVAVVGVFWESVEFTLDTLLGMNMQYSLADTAMDLTFDLLGGAVVAVLAPYILMGRSEKEIVQSMDRDGKVKQLVDERLGQVS